MGDITNPQRLNRYAYVHNDPVNFVDPDGADGRFVNGVYHGDPGPTFRVNVTGKYQSPGPLEPAAVPNSVRNLLSGIGVPGAMEGNPEAGFEIPGLEPNCSESSAHIPAYGDLPLLAQVGVSFDQFNNAGVKNQASLLNIIAALQFAGFDLANVNVTAVEVDGKPVFFNQERVFFAGSGVADWKKIVESEGSGFGDAPGMLHAPGFKMHSFKMDLGKGSLQLSFSDNFNRADVDIDPTRGLHHAGDIIGGIFGQKTSPFDVYNVIVAAGVKPLYKCGNWAKETIARCKSMQTRCAISFTWLLQLLA